MADQSFTYRARVAAANPFGGVIGGKMAAITNRLQGSAMGRAFLGGSAEAFGFYTPGMSDQPVGSFLGLRETMSEMGGRTNRVGQLIRGGRYSAAARYTASGAKRAGWKGSAGWAARFGGKTLLKSIGLVSTAAMAYSGYQQNGAMGAARGVGESIAWNVVPRMIGVGLPAMLSMGAVAAVGLGGYAVAQAGRAHAKGLRTLEMGTPQILEALSSVGSATMRQRSLMALNNTHLNGRMAMGNEAAWMHDGAVSTGLQGRF